MPIWPISPTRPARRTAHSNLKDGHDEPAHDEDGSHFRRAVVEDRLRMKGEDRPEHGECELRDQRQPEEGPTPRTSVRSHPGASRSSDEGG